MRQLFVLLTVVLSNQGFGFQVGDVVSDGKVLFKLTEKAFDQDGLEMFVADNISQGKQVMVKIYSLKAGESNEIIRKSMQTELLVRPRLMHSNIMPIDYSWNDGVYAYVVEEFCEGGRLSDLVGRSPTSESDVKVYLRQILSVLYYLKQERIVLDSLSLDTIYVCPNENFSKLIKLESLGTATHYKVEEFDLEKSQQGVLLAAHFLDCLFIASGIHRDQLSYGGSDLLFRMRLRDPYERITVEGALHHQWLADSEEPRLIAVKRNDNFAL